MALDLSPFLMFAGLFALIFLGLPISFCMISVAFASSFYLFGDKAGVHLWTILLDVARNYTLTAIPMFVLMGYLLARAGIAERLFRAMQLWLGRLPGGMALATIGMCGVFAASTGIVGAVEVVVGLMAIPAMLKAGYNKPLIAGTICAGGSLGTIIPPSVIAVIYASVADMSIGDLMAGIIGPGLITLVAFLGYILVQAILVPGGSPRGMEPELERMPLWDRLVFTAASLLPAIVLIVAVLGSILAGVASPTEAAAVGVLGALILAAAYRRLDRKVLEESCTETVKVTAMIMLIVAGGTMFTSTFILQGGGQAVQALITTYDLSQAAVIAAMVAIVFVLGFAFDWITIVLICTPVFHPIVQALDIDPLWFGVLMIVTLQTSYLTPPMAPSIFYLKSIAPPEMTYRHMFIGVIPFVLCQFLVIAAVILFPATATYLPSILAKF